MNKKSLGAVLNLFVSKEKCQKRKEKETLLIDVEGVCEDKFKGKDTQRSILLVSAKSYEIAKQNGIDIANGDLGENILVDFDPYSLKTGTKLEVGNTLLEISQKSSMCSSLSKISSKLPKLLKDKRGIFAKVVSPGTISKGQNISLLSD